MLCLSLNKPDKDIVQKGSLTETEYKYLYIVLINDVFVCHFKFYND